MTYTVENVKDAWSKFVKYTETAEQHEFVMLAAFQFKMEPLYKDLIENWDDHHAELFMKGMTIMFEKLGIK